ncbi:MAG: helix-turn-helix domain-containing protein [Butyrivibrio sp.]|nr:helix-turn-helix domain-containing protein [Butyrivibrio sp.]
MISNQILQNTIDGIRAIAHMDLCVLDAEGSEVAATTPQFPKMTAAIREFVASAADAQEVQEYQYFKIYDESQLEYVLVVVGSGEHVYMLGKMVAFQIQGLLVAYKERFDRDNFIKNLLLDNLLLVDIYSRAKKLHIPSDRKRISMIIESDAGRESGLLEQVRSCMNARTLGGDDFVTEVDEDSVVMVMDVTEVTTVEGINAAAKEIAASLAEEGVPGVRIAIGTVVGELKEVSRSYKEAKMAMDVGKIFFEDRSVVSYGELGIGRLIYQLPISLCRMFIGEIFGENGPDEFDQETLTTIDKFFENNLNVSETSRQLFIHRNTLVYRLDKLQKSTGLDLRVFDDAITFKIALMVVRYMKYMEQYSY